MIIRKIIFLFITLVISANANSTILTFDLRAHTKQISETDISGSESIILEDSITDDPFNVQYDIGIFSANSLQSEYFIQFSQEFWIWGSVYNIPFQPNETPYTSDVYPIDFFSDYDDIFVDHSISFRGSSRIVNGVEVNNQAIQLAYQIDWSKRWMTGDISNQYTESYSLSLFFRIDSPASRDDIGLYDTETSIQALIAAEGTNVNFFESYRTINSQFDTISNSLVSSDSISTSYTGTGTLSSISVSEPKGLATLFAGILILFYRSKLVSNQI